MSTRDPEVTIKKLVEGGGLESAARELVGISIRCRSMEELRRLLGEPDRVVEWDGIREKKRERFSACFRKSHKQWRRCYSYQKRWLPIYCDVLAYDDGSIRYALYVMKKGEKGKPAI